MHGIKIISWDLGSLILAQTKTLILISGLFLWRKFWIFLMKITEIIKQFFPFPLPVASIRNSWGTFFEELNSTNFEFSGVLVNVEKYKICNLESGVDNYRVGGNQKSRFPIGFQKVFLWKLLKICNGLLCLQITCFRFSFVTPYPFLR